MSSRSLIEFALALRLEVPPEMADKELSRLVAQLGKLVKGMHLRNRMLARYGVLPPEAHEREAEDFEAALKIGRHLGFCVCRRWHSPGPALLIGFDSGRSNIFATQWQLHAWGL